jgi:hypothetical protein
MQNSTDNIPTMWLLFIANLTESSCRVIRTRGIIAAFAGSEKANPGGPSEPPPSGSPRNAGAEDGVRRHECRDLPKHRTTKPLSKFRETAPLTVVEPQASAQATRGFRMRFSSPQKLDDLALLAMEPPTQGCDQELERNTGVPAPSTIDPVVGHYDGSTVLRG